LKDYYKILDVSEDALEKDIKAAYRKLAMKYHPDKNPGNSKAENKFKEISEAYGVLGDERKRQDYDLEKNAPPGMGGFSWSQDFGGFGFDSSNPFASIFNAFTGGGRRQTRQNSDLRFRIQINFDDSIKGCEKNISFNKREACKECEGLGSTDISSTKVCSSCEGSGKVRHRQGPITFESACPSCSGNGCTPPPPCSSCLGHGWKEINESLNIKFKPGVLTGDTLRFKGIGDGAIYGISPGDLYVEVLTENSNGKFYRDGDNIFISENITFVQAALGGKIEVETLHGKKILTIPRGCRDGSKLMLKGMGVKRERRSGDQLVELNIQFPLELTEEQESLLNKLSETMKDKE
jgi:molecular chaperone DnaJ